MTSIDSLTNQFINQWLKHVVTKSSDTDRLQCSVVSSQQRQFITRTNLLNQLNLPLANFIWFIAEIDLFLYWINQQFKKLRTLVEYQLTLSSFWFETERQPVCSMPHWSRSARTLLTYRQTVSRQYSCFCNTGECRREHDFNHFKLINFKEISLPFFIFIPFFSSIHLITLCW